MGTIFAVFQTDGVNTRKSDRSNKYDSGPESDSDNFFTRILGISSESMLKVGVRRFKTFRTVNTENIMLLSSLLVIEAKCGVSSLSIEYTEAKHLLKTCAMEKGSISCSLLSLRMQLSLDFENNNDNDSYNKNNNKNNNNSNSNNINNNGHTNNNSNNNNINNKNININSNTYNNNIDINNKNDNIYNNNSNSNAE